MIEAVENGGDPSEYFAEPLKRAQGKQASTKQNKGATVRAVVTTNGSRPSVTKNRFVTSKDRAMSPVNTSKKNSPAKAPEIKPKAVRKTEPSEEEEPEVIKRSRKEIRDDPSEEIEREEEKEMPEEENVPERYEDEDVEVEEDYNKIDSKEQSQKDKNNIKNIEESLDSVPKPKDQIIEKKKEEI